MWQRAFFWRCSTCSHYYQAALLLNIFGLWIWKFSCYVRHIDSGDLPPFIRAVLQVNSLTSFLRHGRIISNRLQDHNDRRVLQSLEEVDQATGLIAEIMTTIKTQYPPRNRSMICGITRLGGMTRSFQNLRDLAEYVAA